MFLPFVFLLLFLRKFLKFLARYAILVDELVESLQSYKFDLPKTNKFKSMALKLVDDVDDNGFDDELSSIKIAYLAKNF